MQSVIETEGYLRAANDAKMAEEEMVAAVDLVSTDPEAGDVMAGTGGVRKARLAGRGKGKSGGYRIVWYFGGGDIPVFLLAVFGKGADPRAPVAKLVDMRAWPKPGDEDGDEAEDDA